jgi:hypothetical protein
LPRGVAVAGLTGLLLAAASGSSAPTSTPRLEAPTSSVDARPAASLALLASPLSEDQRILHALNRLGYGPRPGDVDRVRRMGLAPTSSNSSTQAASPIRWWSRPWRATRS